MAVSFPFFEIDSINLRLSILPSKEKQFLIDNCPDISERWRRVAEDYYRNLFSEGRVGLMEFKISDIYTIEKMLDCIDCLCGDYSIKYADKMRILAWFLGETFKEYPIFTQIKEDPPISD